MELIERYYRLPQAAADAVQQDGIARVVTGVDQDGAASEHVLWRDTNGQVRSMLAADWAGGAAALAMLARWEPIAETVQAEAKTKGRGVRLYTSPLLTLLLSVALFVPPAPPAHTVYLPVVSGRPDWGIIRGGEG